MGLRFAAGVSDAGGAHAVLDNAAAQALMIKDGCAACHEIDRKLIGEAAMPPNVLASDADIKDLVDWILILKK
jgi:cytochrome c551/c552